MDKNILHSYIRMIAACKWAHQRIEALNQRIELLKLKNSPEDSLLLLELKRTIEEAEGK